MSYLDTPTDADRRDSVVQLYEAERARFGDVPNYARVFALRPTVCAAWAGLNTAVVGRPIANAAAPAAQDR